jgi:hypothetical protein
MSWQKIFIRVSKLTSSVILDFTKAFDKVPHNKLLMKIENNGIRGNTWRWVRSFLSDITRQALLDGEKSSQLPVVSGVPPYKDQY